MRYNVKSMAVLFMSVLALGGNCVSAQTTKSKSKAIWLSFAIPGLGEYYLNNWKTPATGNYFVGAEILTWSGYFYMKSYGGWVQNDAKALAAQKAGVKLNSAKPSNYYYTISKNASIYSYNESERRLHAGANVYAETADNYWQWKDEHSRKKYNALRYDGATYRRLASYMVFAGLINRVFSMAQTARVFRNMHKSGVSMHVDIIPTTAFRTRTEFSLVKHF